MQRLAPWILTALVLAGCPGGSEPADPLAADGRRTLAAERRQAQERLDELAAAATPEAEATALGAFVLWLDMRRPWRTHGYRVTVRRSPDGPPLGRGELEALAAAGEQAALTIAVPELGPDAPTTTRTFLDPQQAARLGPVLQAPD